MAKVRVCTSQQGRTIIVGNQGNVKTNSNLWHEVATIYPQTRQFHSITDIAYHSTYLITYLWLSLWSQYMSCHHSVELG